MFVFKAPPVNLAPHGLWPYERGEIGEGVVGGGNSHP
jgi:hypothetical protein